MKLRLPPKVTRIIQTLNVNGYEAYAVGGCVRDSVLMRQPNDWDITTSAKPLEIKSVFQKTIDTGLQHGTVTVLMDGEAFEVTTYRIDGEYEDARHPKEVIYTADLKEDLRRRDFTINAMAYSETDGLVDCFGGMRDLQCRILRCVGNPRERFTEDALRILRAVRFSAQLGFAIEEETKDAILEFAPQLTKISAERIQAELIKLVDSNHPEYFQTCYELGITQVIMPEFEICMQTPQVNPHHMYCVGDHMLKSMTFIRPEKALRLTMLLHDIGKPQTRQRDENGVEHYKGHNKVSSEMAKDILQRLKFDNDTIYKVTKLIYWHDYRPNLTGSGVRRAIHKVGEDLFPLLLEVQRADILAQSSYKIEEKTAAWKQLCDIYKKILEENQCISLKQLAINGKDLIALGVEPGKQIGEILQKLLELVLEYPHCNTKMYLSSYVKEKLM